MFRRKKTAAKPIAPDEGALLVFGPQSTIPVARVVLNGYSIEQSKSLGRYGAMCSFKIVEGDLWAEWHAQTQLILRGQAGDEAFIKITALPVEEDSYGLIEFIQ
ncbi:MAG TPA: hypothetical protein PLD25_20240 [Chloroflexota bacterium]|nr:hypothetical protein [Chloroflexota bacterium]HUM68475.1 hypothetical protein [Chloroflexota bacterium]